MGLCHGGRGCGFNSIGPPGRRIAIRGFTEPSFFLPFKDFAFDFVFPLFFAMECLLAVKTGQYRRRMFICKPDTECPD